MDPASNGAIKSIVDCVLKTAALRCELFSAYVILVLFIFFTSRYFISGFHLENTLIITFFTLGVSVLVAVKSLVFIALYRSQRIPHGWLEFSTIADAGYFFSAMLSNIVGQTEQYEGILRLPEIVFVVFLVLASGFRFSYRIALLGGLANLMSFFALILVDQRMTPAQKLEYSNADIVVWAALLCLTGFSVALILIVVRNMAQVIALESRELAELKNTTFGLITTHHDASSVTTSLGFTVEDLAAAAARGDLVRVERGLALLSEDLTHMRAMIQGVRQSAMGTLVFIHEPEPIEVGSALKYCTDSLAHRFSELRFKVSRPQATGSAWISGGREGLYRIVSNIADNCLKHSDSSGGSLLFIEGLVKESWYCLTFSHIQEHGGSDSGKGASGGWGVGLLSVEKIVSCSGGSATFSHVNGHFTINVKLPLSFQHQPSEKSHEAA